MIDLVLFAASRAALVTWGETHPPGRPIIESVDDGEGGTIKRAVTGIEWSPWAGNGNFMTVKGTYDQDGTEITPPTFASGYVAKLRIHGEYFDWDKLDTVPADSDDVKEWERSKIADYIQANGTPGTMGTIPYYEVDGIRIFREKDVQEFLSTNSIPGHGFL